MSTATTSCLRFAVSRARSKPASMKSLTTKQTARRFETERKWGPRAHDMLLCTPSGKQEFRFPMGERSGGSPVLVVKPAEMGDCDDAAKGGRFNRSRVGSVPVKREVGPRAVVVPDVLLHASPKVVPRPGIDRSQH